MDFVDLDEMSTIDNYQIHPLLWTRPMSLSSDESGTLPVSLNMGVKDVNTAPPFSVQDL